MDGSDRSNSPRASAALASATRGGRIGIAFRRDAGAHNAVVSEVWLWESK